MRDEVEVAIIGAGAAGLAASRLLTEAGIDALLLEARDRIGGRAYTVDAHGIGLDLGCGYLHSGDINPWTTIAETLGFEVNRRAPPWGEDSRHYGARLNQAIDESWDGFYARLDELEHAPTDLPCSAAFAPGDPFNGMLDAMSGFINGAPWSAVSVIDHARYVDTSANWRVRAGYGALVSRFGHDLPIELGAVVQTVRHDGARLRIETTRGTIEAQKLIVTIPASLLAAGALRFAPELPDKIGAAANLPLGHVTKLFLRMPDTACRLLPPETHVLGRCDTSRTGSYLLRPYATPIAECFFPSDLALDIERMGMEAATDFVATELGAIFGARLTAGFEPIAMHGWNADPFSRGGYSYARPGHADDRAILAAPVDDRIFFAGEATSREAFSTAHGAYASGIIAASRCCEQLPPRAPRSA
ncbi:MAG: Monoamine oxidase [Rhodospirillales bacterium]|nr:Monoamine oxidase [Rhodospirillales bacterium]